jgi:hypothetical protein
MNDNEQRVKELEAALAQVTAERDELSARLDAIKNGGFSFEAAMKRIEAKQRDNAEYQRLMEESFEKGASETTKYI